MAKKHKKQIADEISSAQKVFDVKSQLTETVIIEASAKRTKLTGLVDTGRTLSGNMNLYEPIMKEADEIVDPLKDLLKNCKTTEDLDLLKSKAKTVSITLDRLISTVGKNNRTIESDIRTTGEALFTAFDDMCNHITAMASLDKELTKNLKEELKITTDELTEEITKAKTLHEMESLLEKILKTIDEIDFNNKTIIRKMEELKMRDMEEVAKAVINQAIEGTEVVENNNNMEGKEMENNNTVVNEEVVTDNNEDLLADMYAYEEEMAMAAADAEYEAMKAMAEAMKEENVETKNNENEKENEAMNTVNNKEVNKVIEEAMEEAVKGTEDFEDTFDEDVEDITEENTARIIDKVKEHFTAISRFIPEVKDNLDMIADMAYVEAYVYVRKACIKYVRKFGKVKFMAYSIEQVKKGLGYIKGLLVKLIKKVAKGKSNNVLKGIGKAFGFVGGVIKKVAGMLFNAAIFAGTSAVKALYGLGKLIFTKVADIVTQPEHVEDEEDDVYFDEDEEIIDVVVTEMNDEMEDAINKAADEMIAEMGLN